MIIYLTLLPHPHLKMLKKHVTPAWVTEKMRKCSFWRLFHWTKIFSNICGHPIISLLFFVTLLKIHESSTFKWLSPIWIELIALLVLRHQPASDKLYLYPSLPGLFGVRVSLSALEIRIQPVSNFTNNRFWSISLHTNEPGAFYHSAGENVLFCSSYFNQVLLEPQSNWSQRKPLKCYTGHWCMITVQLVWSKKTLYQLRNVIYQITTCQNGSYHSEFKQGNLR